jgi:ATP-dependent RNA helicase RhlE
MSFADLNLIPELQRAVADEGYSEPTPIQAKAIPAVLERRDIMGCAQTGTGKTAGFTLPMLQLLAPYANSSPSPARHPVRALVLTPTRELAAQVSDSVKAYGKFLKLRSTVVYGGVDMPPQTKILREGVDILVATPGRLLDHVQQKSVSLGQVEIVVMDEADRMLDMGFLPDIRRILALLPTQRQSLLFSATFSEEIKKLANQMLRSPTLIEVARRNAPADLVKHQVFETPASRKHAVLANLIRSRDMKQVLVFLRMKRDCNKLARDLVRDGINATAIHSDRTQAEREQALTDFKEGRSTVLVATDIAARGIDIEELPFVINYELPYTPEDYVHRIGRTGRAGMPGEAISLVCPDEMRLLADIEKLLKRAIPRQSVEEGAANLAAEREYERGKERERRPRREERNDEPRRAVPAAPLPKPRPQVAADGFDFSKPYEPTSGPTTASAPPPPQRQRTGRPTAALLGGFLARGKK